MCEPCPSFRRFGEPGQAGVDALPVALRRTIHVENLRGGVTSVHREGWPATPMNSRARLRNSIQLMVRRPPPEHLRRRDKERLESYTVAYKWRTNFDVTLSINAQPLRLFGY